VTKVQNARAAVSPARAAAFDILLRVDRESSYASELLHSRAYATLSELDHALATELVMGVLRWRSFLDSEISVHSSQPLAKLDLEILLALRLVVYQLLWLSRIPARAAINESVELVKRARKRSAASFVNAVLRKISIRSPSPPVVDGSSSQALATTSAHAEWIVDRWCKAYGTAAAQQMCRYDQFPPLTSIRLRNISAEDQLRADGIKLIPGFMLASARTVQSGGITKTSAFKKGDCVIQDEASQLVAHLLGHGKNILDCCAAPGGKTLVLADRNPGAHIIAVDLHPHRARLLKKLVRPNRQSGSDRESVLNVVAGDACALPFATKFDRILADVPCSGTGTLARNPEIKWRLTPEDIANLQARQFAILCSAMEHVASGGRIVYSTCSLEREENEEVIDRALAENSFFHVVECRDELERLCAQGELNMAGISSLMAGPYLRTLPGIHPCDGFFAAILEKHG
jgi:16S rRNA (cytosine967-C5)-methyltransferase